MKNASSPVLVIGCGGIGGVVIAGLLEQGLSVTAVAKRAEIANALNTHGVRVTDEEGPRVVRGELTVSVDVPSERPNEGYGVAILAVQPTQVEQAAQQVAPLLSREGAVVCLQNGLCEERVAKLIGEEKVIGGVVAFGASVTEPGVYERTSAGGFTLGRLSGSEDERLRELARVLEAIGPVEFTRNLRGARWSKLALNSAISSLGTIGGMRLGSLLVHRFVRRLALEIMTEAVLVAQAEGVSLEKISGTVDLNWLALTDSERKQMGSPSLLAKHSLILAVGARYRRLRSSMLAGIERGREPPVDFLNGEIVERGARHHIATPVNAAVQALIHGIFAKRHRSALETLRALYEQTRTGTTAEAA
ncbi:MAG: ketopantoate reductase family protein [Myxococcaceae bacterium]